MKIILLLTLLALSMTKKVMRLTKNKEDEVISGCKLLLSLKCLQAQGIVSEKKNVNKEKLDEIDCVPFATIKQMVKEILILAKDKQVIKTPLMTEDCGNVGVFIRKCSQTSDERKETIEELNKLKIILS